MSSGLCEYVSTRNDLGHETLALQFTVPHILDGLVLKFSIRRCIPMERGLLVLFRLALPKHLLNENQFECKCEAFFLVVLGLRNT